MSAYPAARPHPTPQARFRALHFETWYHDEDKYDRMFHACCILHNICIKMGDKVSKKDIATATECEAQLKENVRGAAATAAAQRAAAAAMPLPAGGGAGAALNAGRTLQARLFWQHQKMCLPDPWNYTVGS